MDPALGATVSVYNRLGQLVYHTEGAVVDWDGTYKARRNHQALMFFTFILKMIIPILKERFY
ncbi:MAG: gliding motility-associated C-terminal domain-containing protein [Ferruginibacter sp.]